MLAHTRHEEKSRPSPTPRPAALTPSPTPRHAATETLAEATNTVTQVGDSYWIVSRGDKTVGVIVALDNDTYIVYCDDIPVTVFANSPAAVEFAGKGVNSGE